MFYDLIWEAFELRIVKPFDPWRGKLCTCPPKFTLNPYTGCEHACLYCYITAFIPQAFRVREKKDLLKKVYRDLQSFPKGSYLTLSNSSDPYPSLEKDLKLTRQVLSWCSEFEIPVLVITKSSLVCRDMDVLLATRSAVSITLTTLCDEVARKLEPGAPLPGERKKAIIELARNGIPVILRLDPIIPGVNDNPEQWEKLIEEVSPFIVQVVSSTYKLRADSWKRITRAFSLARRYRNDYCEKHGNSLYLRKEVREHIIGSLRELVTSYNLPFSSCREGFVAWNDLVCDGSYFLNNQNQSKRSSGR